MHRRGRPCYGKTVEAHITRLYAKLDVRSRTQLKARARNGELELTLTPQP